MPSAARPDWSGRLHKLWSLSEPFALDALVVSSGVNLTYLTGFRGSSGLLVLTRGDAFLLVDGRYVGAVREALRDGSIAPVCVELVESRFDLALSALLGRLASRRVGFEAVSVTVAALGRWRDAVPGAEWVATDGLVERLRLVKDETEVAIFRRAGRALSDVARSVGTWLAAGRSERDVARDIDAALDRAGFSGPAFPTIVAAGLNSAHPHARPSGHRLARGELVVLDFGGVLDGYCVDLTRTAVLGRPSAAVDALFRAVEAGHAAALAAIRPGARGADVDAAARSVLETRGFGRAFVHATGHGLGLEVHEAPRLARADAGPAELLQAGMVCTVEPGAYVEGLGGVRLEDDVLVTVGGCETLTDAPRDLLVV